MAFEKERKVAFSAVQTAAKLCVSVQQKIEQIGAVDKTDKSPVTIADFATQAIISHLLQQQFPDIPLVGEEDASELRSNAELCNKMMNEIDAINFPLNQEQALKAIDRGIYQGGSKGRHWTLDPIDGTKGFLRGDQYAIALALIEEGEVVLGVLGCPNLPHSNSSDKTGAIFVAAKGQGVEMFELGDLSLHAVNVATVEELGKANFCESVERGHSSHSDSAMIATLLGIDVPPYRIDSQCKYAAVAKGDAVIYLRLPTRPGYVEKIWDHAAGVCVVQEAGGVVTDVYGNTLNFSLGRELTNNKGVVVSNGQFHDEIISAVRTVLKI
jgi:3'(2'), 5'-bisphosphate nucleotidase